MKPLECKGLLGHECRLAYRPRTAGTQRTESGLPRNGEILYIAFLDDRKKCNEVALDDTVGATGRGGVAGEGPIGMRDERGVVGKHPIGKAGAARCKHGVCGQIGVGAKASAVEFSQANLHSQLSLRFESIEKDCTY